MLQLRHRRNIGTSSNIPDRNGCFYKLGSFCGRPCKQGPTLWGPCQGPLSLSDGRACCKHLLVRRLEKDLEFHGWGPAWHIPLVAHIHHELPKPSSWSVLIVKPYIEITSSLQKMMVLAVEGSTKPKPIFELLRPSGRRKRPDGYLHVTSAKCTT